MRWRNADLVDPKLLCRLVWVQVVDRACKANDLALVVGSVDCNHKVMARLIEKLDD